MKELIGPEVDLKEMNKHAALLYIVGDLLRSQAQPGKVIAANDYGLVFDLRVNLAKASCENLIVKPLRDSLIDYDVSVDYDSRKMMVSLKEFEEGDQVDGALGEIYASHNQLLEEMNNIRAVNAEQSKLLKLLTDNSAKSNAKAPKAKKSSSTTGEEAA